MRFLVLILLSLNCYGLQDDKLAHTAFSAAISSGWYEITESKTSALAVCMAVGVAKEVADEIRYGGFSNPDLLADGLGCLIGVYSPVPVFISDDRFQIEYTLKF
ncbi:hypothetical protein [Endozoicomonas acroporae]|uniref:hypothetical protein n=1 Tax=Endozoicomonas acroporae TaxID=1701104 RepID=UPI003D7B5DE6